MKIDWGKNSTLIVDCLIIMEKYALLFSGQGSQYLGMCDKLCERYPVASRVFEEASEEVKVDLRKLGNTSIDEITLTSNAQPLILTTSIAMFESLKTEVDIEYSTLVGHSLGEISALVASGAIALGDAVKIVRKRGECMQQAVSEIDGAMLAVHSREPAIIEQYCSEIDPSLGKVEIANYNSKVQIVISGERLAIKKIQEKLDLENIKSTLLNVSAPFHSSYMKRAAETFRDELSRYKFETPKLPVLSSDLVTLYDNSVDIISTLSNQLYRPVRWSSSMNYLYAQNITCCIELGPGNTLKNLMKTNISNIPVFSFDSFQEVNDLQSYIEQKRVPFLSRSMGIAVATKNNNFDNHEYNSGVVKPYGEIKILTEEIEKEGRIATYDEMIKAIQMLKSVFKTKRTPNEEQKQRFEELFQDTGTKNEFSNFTLN